MLILKCWMLLPSWNQSWWCRCSFDKLYLWTITCGLVSVLTRQIICPDWSEPETVWPWSSDSHNERVSSSLGSHWSEAGVLGPDWSIVRVSHAHMCDEGITVSCLWSVSRQFIRYRHNYNQRRARGNAPNGLSEAEHRLDLRHVICLTFLNPIIQSLKHSATFCRLMSSCVCVQ